MSELFLGTTVALPAMLSLMNQSKFMTLVGLVVLVAAWFVLRAVAPQSAQWLFAPWRGMTIDHGWWVPAIGGGLLVALEMSYLATVWPRRWRRGDDAVGLGCVSMAAIGVGVVIALLAASVLLQWWAVVNFISFMTMVMALLIMPQYYWAKYKDWRKKE
jgi:hypothetical protein